MNCLNYTIFEYGTPIMNITQSNRQDLNSPRMYSTDDSHAKLYSTSCSDHPKFLECIEAKRADTYRKHVFNYMVLASPALTFRKERILIRKPPFRSAIQKVVPTSLR